MDTNNPPQQGFHDEPPMHPHFGHHHQPGLFQPKKLPNAVAVLVLGILSITCCGFIGLVLSIIALAMSVGTMNHYQAFPQQYTKQSYNMVVAGRICAIIGLLLSILSSIMSVSNLINGNSMLDFLD